MSEISSGLTASSSGNSSQTHKTVETNEKTTDSKKVQQNIVISGSDNGIQVSGSEENQSGLSEQLKNELNLGRFRKKRVSIKNHNTRFLFDNQIENGSKLPFLTSNEISDLNFDSLSINSEPALNSRTNSSLLSQSQQKQLKQRLLDHQRALQITVEIKRLQAEKEKLEQEQFVQKLL